jgi:enamine deaminase RidA (YjgF/YER057c/UK114 family)
MDRGIWSALPPLMTAAKSATTRTWKFRCAQTYANAKKILSEFGATLDDVVEEVLYVTDMDIAFAVAGPVRKEAYGAKRPEVASTILVTPRLALPTQLIEIKFIAKVR